MLALCRGQADTAPESNGFRIIRITIDEWSFSCLRSRISRFLGLLSGQRVSFVCAFGPKMVLASLNFV
jgi:hypothetical protein